MIKSLLIANRGEIACRIIRTPILPGTGRGTARSVVEGSGEGACSLQVCSLLIAAPPSLRATSPFRGGFYE